MTYFRVRASSTEQTRRARPWSAGRAVAALAGAAAFLATAPAFAVVGQPDPWEVTLQPAGSEVMSSIRWFGDFTLIIISLIVVLVAGLLAVCIVKFNAKANPTPARTSHNTLIEVIWTVGPILVLVMIAIPSFRLLYQELDLPPADLTLKVTGYQWYWGYEYPDAKYAGIQFDSYMLSDDDRKARMAQYKLDATQAPRLLTVDNEVVVPVGKNIRVQVTGADVIHSFAMPAFGVKIDAIPGRLNETWFKAERPGTYYGQCSELCGTNHAFMPIAIRAVPEDQFEKWAEAAKSDIGKANALLFAMDSGTGATKTVADAQ